MQNNVNERGRTTHSRRFIYRLHWPVIGHSAAHVHIVTNTSSVFVIFHAVFCFTYAIDIGTNGKWTGVGSKGQISARAETVRMDHSKIRTKNCSKHHISWRIEFIHRIRWYCWFLSEEQQLSVLVVCLLRIE